jgi:putative membrane protein
MESFVVLLLTVLGIAAGPVHAADNPAGKPAAQTANAPSAADVNGYVEKAATADMFEVQSSQMALEKTKDPSLRKFAEHMVNDHTKSSHKLQDTLKAANIAVTPPAKLDQAHQDQLAQLRSASGDQFDRQYRDMQLQGHQEALKLHSDYSKNGGNEALKRFATETAPVVQQHLNEIQALNKTGLR